MIANSSIYGQALLHFPELFEPFKYFNMDSQYLDNYIIPSGVIFRGTDANYQIPRAVLPSGMYLGIVQNNESGVKDSNGNLANYVGYYLWCEENLQAGWFIRMRNNIFRIMKDNDWSKYAGFNQYEIEKLIGSDGQGVTPSNLSGGIGELR